MPHLSIIIPAYNEAERLPATLETIQKYLVGKKFTYEVVVVDDCSKDETVALVEKMTKSFPGLRVITNIENKGKGGVVKQGMLDAKGKFRLFMDADHSTPITELDKFLPYLDHYDVIIGSRYMQRGSIKIKQPLQRRIVSRLGNFLIQRSVLPGIVDTQCGFKLFSAAATEAIFNRQTMKGWAFDVELLTIAKEQGLSIKEVPVDWYDDQNSKLRAVHASQSFYKDLQIIKANVRAKVYKKPVKR